jgi:hypothetical protein
VDGYATISEVAREFRVWGEHIRRMCADGRLSAVRAPIKTLAIQIWPFCAARPPCLRRVSHSGWLHTQRRRSIQAAYVQLLCIDEYRVLLFLRLLRGLLCQL